MKKLVCLLATLLTLTCGATLAGCDLLGAFGPEESEEEFPQIDNSIDLDEYTPTPDDEYVQEDKPYFTSTAIDLVTEINGNYTADRPFILDEEDESKRIFRNLYFYEEDFFQVIYYEDITDLGKIFAILSDETDTQYAAVEYSDGGSPLQINIVQEGIYNLILDINTFAIDMVKVGDIQTPVYETIKACELYVHRSASDATYTPMTLNGETNEYYVQMEIPLDTSIGFFNAAHTGRYKMTVDAGINDKLIYWDWLTPEKAYVHIGGTYNVYFHAKTYVLRLELVNPDSASYYCQVGFNQGVELTASADAPYLFTYEFMAQGERNDPYVELPDFYPILGMKYALTVIDECGFVFNGTDVTESGTYRLTVNLKEFTLTVERIS